MRRWILMAWTVLAVAGAALAQSAIDSWDFNVADGALSTHGSFSDLGAGGITWPDKTVVAISNNTAVFFGQGTNSTQNYFGSASGISANQNETSGTYQLSVDVVSAGFVNTAALDQNATWGIGVRSSAGDDAACRLTYEGRLNVTNVNTSGITNIVADADNFQLSVVSDGIDYNVVDLSIVGNTLSNLNIRQVFDMDAGTYEVYYTLDPAAEALLYSGNLPAAFNLSELRIASQQYNGNAIWEAGDILAVDNFELTQLVAPTEEDPYTTIEQWDFTSDSLTGVNGNNFPSLEPSVWNDVAGDDALTMAPTNNQYVTRNMTVTPGGGDMYISWTLSSWDLDEMATRSSAYFGLNGAGHIGVEIYNDTSTNAWVAIRSANAQVVKARIAKGITSGTGPLQVTARLDFTDGEVQLFVSADGNWLNWSGVQWADSATIAAQYTASFDFSTVLSVGDFTQTRMAATGLASNEQVTVDQIFIKEEPASDPPGVSVVDKFGGPQNNVLETVTLGTYTDVQPNDVVVLVSSGSNKNHLQSSFVNWVSSDGGVIGATQFFTQSSVGIWYATIQTGGTFDVNYTKTNNYTTVGAYLVRASSGGTLQFNTQGKYLAKAVTSTSAALTYDFGAASDGVVIESVSTGAQPGATPDNVLIDYSNSGKREVGNMDFANTTILNTSWSIDQSATLANVGLGGIAIYADYVPPAEETTPSSLYADWLGSETSNTNLLEDVNGDGVNNLIDYAIGGAINLPLSSVDGGYLQYVHIQWDETESTARGLSYEVQAASNLVSGTWSTNDVEFVGSATDTPAAGYLTVTNRIPTTDDTEFARLNITFTTP